MTPTPLGLYYSLLALRPVVGALGIFVHGFV
jgi:hypothetical protein